MNLSDPAFMKEKAVGYLFHKIDDRQHVPLILLYSWAIHWCTDSNIALIVNFLYNVSLTSPQKIFFIATRLQVLPERKR